MLINFKPKNIPRLQQLEVYKDIRKTREMAKDMKFWKLVCKIFLPKKCLLGCKQ